jgi:hypothetical protein
MALNIVSNTNVIVKLSTSKYFRRSLGLVQTVEKGSSRVLNQKDPFNYFYSMRYNAMLYGQGNVGDIKFYVDQYILEDALAVYYGDNFEEFVFEFDSKYVDEKGADSYLGFILKECDRRYEELKVNNELKKLEPKPQGHADKLVNNPGQVTYEDVKAYMEEKRRNAQL